MSNFPNFPCALAVAISGEDEKVCGTFHIGFLRTANGDLVGDFGHLYLGLFKMTSYGLGILSTSNDQSQINLVLLGIYEWGISVLDPI